MEKMKKEISLQIARTDTWANYLGLWKCTIQTLEPNESDKEAPLKASILIYLPSSSDQASSTAAESSTSWFCCRTVNKVMKISLFNSIFFVFGQIPEFHKLNRELLPFGLKNMDLPNASKSLFPQRNNNTKAALEKSRQLLQHFMDTVMDNETLNGSEVVYNFLSPAPSPSFNLPQVEKPSTFYSFFK